MVVKTKHAFALDERYLDLITDLFPLRPIRTDDEHKLALKALRSLGNDDRRFASDYRKVLASLIQNYEVARGFMFDSAFVTAAAIVNHLLEERGMSIIDFAKAIGISATLLTGMLNGKKPWTTAAIVRTADFFKLKRGEFFERTL